MRCEVLNRSAGKGRLRESIRVALETNAIIIVDSDSLKKDILCIRKTFYQFKNIPMDIIVWRKEEDSFCTILDSEINNISMERPLVFIDVLNSPNLLSISSTLLGRIVSYTNQLPSNNHIAIEEECK